MRLLVDGVGKWKPSPTNWPAASSTRTPTIGFGLVRPCPREASCSARAIQRRQGLEAEAAAGAERGGESAMDRVQSPMLRHAIASPRWLPSPMAEDAAPDEGEGHDFLRRSDNRITPVSTFKLNSMLPSHT